MPIGNALGQGAISAIELVEDAVVIRANPELVEPRRQHSRSWIIHRGLSLRCGAAGRPRSAGSAGQSLAQRRPLAADPGPYAADHCNDRNEQDTQKHRVFDQSGAILVFAQAADESQSV
jgi:hypothetical protein